MARRIKLRLRFSRSQAGRFGRMTSLSVGTAVAVILSFLAVTFAYTCPGLAFMRASGYSYSATPHKIKADPCHHAKKDICQSVRDRLLSLQVSSFQVTLSGSPYIIADFSFLPLALNPQSDQPAFFTRKWLISSLFEFKRPYSLYSTVRII